jgi:hypothetical protein
MARLWREFWLFTAVAAIAALIISTLRRRK